MIFLEIRHRAKPGHELALRELLEVSGKLHASLGGRDRTVSEDGPIFLEVFRFADREAYQAWDAWATLDRRLAAVWVLLDEVTDSFYGGGFDVQEGEQEPPRATP